MLSRASTAPACPRWPAGDTVGVDLRIFGYPGALSLSVLFTAIFSATSISIFHGIVILALVGLAHAPDTIRFWSRPWRELPLLSFVLTAFGVMTAARITQVRKFTALALAPSSGAWVSPAGAVLFPAVARTGRAVPADVPLAVAAAADAVLPVTAIA